MAKSKSAKNTKRSLAAEGFYSDYIKDKTLYAAIVRSPAATGKIKSITADLPEGYFLFTADDIPGEKFIEFNKVSTKIFGFGNVSYTGEPLGIIAGPDEQTVMECLERVSVNFDVENLQSALENVIAKDKQKSNEAEELSQIVEQISDMPSLDTVVDNSHLELEENTNVTVATREIKYGLFENLSLSEIEAKIKEDNTLFKTSDTWELQLYAPNWQETTGSFCYMEDSKIHIYAPTKWSSYLHKAAAKILGIDAQSVFIHKTKTGQIAPNGIWRTSQIALQTAVASYLLKKPVKLMLSQNEQKKFMNPGLPTLMTYKTAVKSDGRIHAMEILIDIDIGTSNPFAQEITDRIALSSFNYYQPENLYVKAVAHTSKNPPTSILINGIDAQAFFAIENQIQKICNLTQISSDEIRSINSQSDKKSNFPFQIPITQKTDEAMQNTIRMSDFNRKFAAFHMDAIDRVQEDSRPFFALPLRGVGIANAYAVSGYFGNSTFSYDSKMDVTLTTDDKVIIHTIKPSIVIQEIWKKTAAEMLQIPVNNITIDSDFELDELPENPADTYSTIGISHELLKKCCAEIQKKRFHQPLPITSKKMLSQTSKKTWDKTNFCGTPFYTVSFAAVAAEVELDPYTYNEKLKGVWVTVDCGDIYDETAAIRTIRMEIQQELTMLVKGRMIPCDNISVQFIKSGNKTGQIGGLIHNTLPAAFSSALSLALATQLTTIPCTETLLFDLIKNRVKKSKQKSKKTESEKKTDNQQQKPEESMNKTEGEIKE